MKEHNKLNLILVGPNQVGRTTVANYMAQEHQRCVIRLDMLVDYWTKRGHAISEEATKFLEEKQAELATAIAALEAQKKAKKPKKGEPEPEINQAEYKLLPRELLIRMIQLRVQEEDCNAGVIFDNLTSENWTDEKFAISMISDAVPLQNVQVLMFNFKHEQVQDKDDQTIDLEVCTNYRFAQRHEAAFAAKRDQKRDDEKVQTADQEKGSPRPNARPPQRKPSKKDKKADELSEEQIAAEAEKLRKKLEAEE